MTTSTHLPLCIYCGTARPADETRCPHCGRPWIDVRVGDRAEQSVLAMAGVAVVAGRTVATASPPPAPRPAAGVPGGGEQPIGDPDPNSDPSRRFVWFIPALIAGIAVIVIGLFGFGLLDGEGATTVAQATTLPPATTAPVTVPPAPSTTVAAATTTSTAPATTTTVPGPGMIAPVGDPIPLSSLTLKAGGIGPIAFEEPATDAIGRLVSSIGKPTETGVTDEDLGLCAGDDGRFVRWDGLTAVVSGTLEDGTFVGYRYDDVSVPTMQLDLSTPSDLRVGDSVARLNEIYSSYQIDYISTAGTDMFRLSGGDGLLLWGPVTSVEDSGRVEGIYAPDVCSG